MDPGLYGRDGVFEEEFEGEHWFVPNSPKGSVVLEEH